MNATPASQCPPEALLSDFGLGKLDAAGAETVSKHLETCADCQARVAGISGDSFIGRLRQAGDARRQGGYVPGESLASSASSTDGAVREDGLPRPSRSVADQAKRDGLGSPSSIGAPPELANHPDYELIKELGQGGMGTVYLAKNRMMDRLEVLKVISTALLARPGALERFQQEIRSAAKLAHPNIVAAYSVLRPGDLLVFAMEYVAGQDLSRVVRQRGYLPVTNAAIYVQQVALGLQHAFEKGMVHRDIKPGNLMLAVDGKKHTVKILDFGLARATSEKDALTGLTASGQMLGTPDYMAPEQILDARRADIRADIYSLGCTLYYLLSGGPPFHERSVYEILEAHHKREPKPLNLVRSDVAMELATIVAKMMAKDPTRRYQTPIEVAKALVPFFKAGESPSIHAPPPDVPSIALAKSSAPLAATAPPSVAFQPAAAIYHAVPVMAPMPIGNQSAADTDIEIHADRPKRRSRHNHWRLAAPLAIGLLVAGGLLAGVVLSLKKSDGGREAIAARVGPVKRRSVKDDGPPLGLQPASEEATALIPAVSPPSSSPGGNPPATADSPPQPATPDDDPTPIPIAAAAGRWIPLFNGKNLNGWQEAEQNKGTWEVIDGVLVGRGGGTSSPAWLRTTRGDFTDFQLRLEMVEPVGIVSVRAPPQGGHPYGFDGYRVALAGGDRRRSGQMLYPGAICRSVGWPVVWNATGTPIPLPAGPLVLEIRVSGNRISTLVAGKVSAEYEDEQNIYPSGAIRLYCPSDGEIGVRRIEVKE